MPDWGRHGAATRDLWDRFQNTALVTKSVVADGNGWGAKWVPYKQEIVDDLAPADGGAVEKYFRDQSMITGGPQYYLSAVTIPPTAPVVVGLQIPHKITGKYESWTQSEPEAFATLSEIQRLAIRKLMYPSDFYHLGWEYLAQLQSSKPAIGVGEGNSHAAVLQRMVWAVDAAWWINMMLASTNIYPSWIADAVGKLSVPGWRVFPWVPQTSDLCTAIPALKPTTFGDPGGWPYRVPFVEHPGQLNSTGLVRGDVRRPQLSLIPGEIARIQRWTALRPWWLGLQSFDVSAQTVSRARREDPDGTAGLERACSQHSFFQLKDPATTVQGDFFTTVAQIQNDSYSRAGFNRLVDQIIPAWLALMQQLPYWQLVRAGNDSWTQYCSGLDVAPTPTTPQTLWRFPFTPMELRAAHRAWKSDHDDAYNIARLQTYFVTAVAFVQYMITGGVGTAQVNALKSMYELSQFKYRAPRAWEMGWETPPIVSRMLYAKNVGLIPSKDTPPLASPGIPDARLMSVYENIAVVNIELDYLSQVGGIALTRNAVTPPLSEFLTNDTAGAVVPLAALVTAFEAKTDAVPRKPPPLPSAVRAPRTPSSTTVAPPAPAPRVSTSSSPYVLPTLQRKASHRAAYVAAGVAAVVGIIVATRKK